MLLVAMSGMKIYIQFEGIVRANPPPVSVGRANDILWTVLALIVPWGLAGIFWMRDRAAGAFAVAVTLQASTGGESEKLLGP